MNCNQCEELIGDFLDGKLVGEDQTTLSSHLDECLSCMGMSDDLRTIIAMARAEREHNISPPNAQTLWMHIRDVIEIEEYPATANQPITNDSRRAINTEAPESFWSRLWSKRWEMSLPQMTAAFASLVIIAALAGALGLQTVRSIGGQDAGANDTNNQAARRGNARPTADDLLRQQQADLEYLNQRVAQRQANWTPQMRETFQRSVAVIDQAVNESINELRANPNDEVSGEMLTVALQNKEELLRQFAEF
jgi:hypothetical protein